MGEALYRKYRPKSLKEVVGQPHITHTLENALQQGRISHGYLFSGPRGVGKTSIARILAHQINQFDYGDSRGSLDIIEIDAASNRRIDEIRDLRDKVHIAPVTGKYKVYIIDEVHMLTREAFNALLKTLEEPPAHVIFIMATTEVHKLPETIVSRTQRYTFKPVGNDDIVTHLKVLAKKEGILISDEALSLIATHGDGSFRDSISLLDQLSSNRKITENEVRELLGLPPDSVINNLITEIQCGNIVKLIELLTEAENNGYSATEIATELSKQLRLKLINGERPFGDQTIRILEKLLLVSTADNPKDYLELILLDITFLIKPSVKLKIEKTKPEPSTKSKPTKEEKVQKKESSTSSQTQKVTIEHNNIKQTNALNGEQIEKALKDGLWETVLNTLKSKYNTLYGVVRMATPSVDQDILILSVPFAFHNKRLSEEKNAAIINSVLFDKAGGPILFKARIDKSNVHKEEASPIKNSGTITAVTEIFGGGEILES